MDRNQLEAIFLKAMGRMHVQGLVDAPPDCSCLHVSCSQADDHVTGVAAKHRNEAIHAAPWGQASQPQTAWITCAMVTTVQGTADDEWLQVESCITSRPNIPCTQTCFSA
jgi:hypothetical protein